MRFRITGVITASLILMMTFQNCKPTKSNRPAESGDRTSGSGNGDVYTGIQGLELFSSNRYDPDHLNLEGKNWYRILNTELCDNGDQVIPSHSGAVRFSEDQFQYQSNSCSSFFVSNSTIEIPAYNPKFLGLENKIFESYLNPPSYKDSPINVLWCRTKWGEKTGTDVIIKKMPVEIGTQLTPSKEIDFRSQSVSNIGQFTRESQATFINNSGYMETSSPNQPRFEFDSITLEPIGLLMEEEKQNLLVWSNDLNRDAWEKDNINIEIKTNNENLHSNLPSFEIQTTDEPGRFLQSVTEVPANQPLTLSLFFKNSSFTRFDISIRDLGGSLHNIDVDLLNKFAASNSNNIRESYFTSYSRDWSRLSVVFNSSSGNLPLEIETQLPANGNIQMFGFQLEVGEFSSSYIPSQGQIGIRAGDSLVSNDVDWYNPNQGSFLVEGSFFGRNHNKNAFLFRIDRFAQNKVEILKNFSDDLSVHVKKDDILIFDSKEKGSRVFRNEIFSAGFSYGDGQMLYFDEGQLRHQDSLESMPSPIANLYIGVGVNNIGQLNGHIRKFRYWNTRLSNNELSQMTEVFSGSSYRALVVRGIEEPPKNYVRKEYAQFDVFRQDLPGEIFFGSNQFNFQIQSHSNSQIIGSGHLKAAFENEESAEFPMNCRVQNQ